MNLTLIAIDKMKSNSPELKLIEGYVKQCGWPLKIIELQASKGLDGDIRKKAESQLLLTHIPPNAKVIALDERGKNISSRDFASTLIGWQDTGTRDIAFLIGGAQGHTDDLRKRADLILSFGKMTLPHLLMRVVVCEQLYRAYTISINHPYHKD